MTINDTGLLLAAAREGNGLAYLIEDLVEPFLESGELTRVLDPYCTVFSGFYLYYPQRAHTASSVRAFIDFMKVKGA
ncbi:LysR substrate-binding domain-containing protein [Rhizobium sp. YIM 134829]|uniref:LysR substrate-binding domain-containing protein n=1 Tax=Rhizobium sp. YIM 134829 TaxID=3390453 RepID=UPI00397D1B7D